MWGARPQGRAMPGPPPLVAVSGRTHPQPQGSPLGRSPTLTASGDPGLTRG